MGLLYNKWDIEEYSILRRIIQGQIELGKC